jgi:hypothetical protein
MHHVSLSSRLAILLTLVPGIRSAEGAEPPLPKIRVGADGRSFVTETGQRFVPFGVNYFRPGNGWAPQVWKKFELEAVRSDFNRMRELGVNCVRVFLTYGSFFIETNRLHPEGVRKFDQLLEIAESAGIYIHPTGPDHWEGMPEWAVGDRIASETVLTALESFWRLLGERYRGRNVIFAYDLLNEPAVGWDTPMLRAKWNRWLEQRYGSAEKTAQAWGVASNLVPWGQVPPPPPKDAPGDKRLLDYQLFREDIADDWTRRQVLAIKSVDRQALVTVGLIQWSVPVLLPAVSQYAGFRPERQARWLDFLEVHFYPLEGGFYEYLDSDAERRNLAYLESVVREVAAPGKPVVLAEFGWYGGGQLTIDGGRHRPAGEVQQAEWCRKAVETTRGLASGWLNWGLYDHPEARDVTQLTGLLSAHGSLKEWGREFQRLSARLKEPVASSPAPRLPPAALARPTLDWNVCLTSVQAGHEFRKRYGQAFLKGSPSP